jgi:hypothetical protein
MTADTNSASGPLVRRPDEPQPFGDDTTYRLGARFADCDSSRIGAAAGLVPPIRARARYRGIDGSRPPSPRRSDLASYRSHVPGIFVRYVLEHDYRWAQILDNAVAPFTELHCRRLTLSPSDPRDRTTATPMSLTSLAGRDFHRPVPPGDMAVPDGQKSNPVRAETVSLARTRDAAAVARTDLARRAAVFARWA